MGPFWKTTVCALSAGGLAAVVGNPADLSLIRMQADTMLPEAERRNYRGVGNALTSIVRDEGIGGLFKGAVPTATRAMALNFGMLGFNTLAKDKLADLGCKKAGKLYLCGGYNGVQCLSSVECFDPSISQWQRLSPMSMRRESAAIAVVARCLLIFGGKDSTECLRLVERFDPAVDAWRPMPSMSG